MSESEFMSSILKFIFALSPTLALVALVIFFPEKVEKWVALFWKLVDWFGRLCGGLFKYAHKKYIKHDLQGRINDFIRSLRNRIPSLTNHKFRIEWIDPLVERKCFIENDTLVLRLRRDDPEENNFVHGAYLYVAGTLLHKCKRYISPSQRDAVDLFVCSKLLEREKPSTVGTFMDEYLHPGTADRNKVALLVDDFSIIESGSLFFPIFVQELEYLGDKVFGKPKSQLMITEVTGLIDFLKPIALRKVGDDSGDMTFEGQYCRFGIVIVGKPMTLATSINPYVNWIRNQLVAKDAETIYILARPENRSKVQVICSKFQPDYGCDLEITFGKTLHYPNGNKQKISQYLAILRKRGIQMVQPSQSPSAVSTPTQIR